MTAIPELPTGLKWSFEFDPSTGGYIPRIIITNSEGENIVEGDAITTIDYAHHEVHEGDTYQVTTYTGTVANDSSWALMLSLTGTVKYAHLTWEAQAGGDAELRFYANVTGSSYGTKMNSFNMDHGSTKIATVEVFRNPTITVTNEAIIDQLMPGGTGPQSGGGGFRQGTEHILAPGKRYLLIVYNRSGQSKPMSLGVQWYESTIGGET